LIEQRERIVRADAPLLKTIPPATRVVPGSVQRITPRNLAAESYAEIPASNLGSLTPKNASSEAASTTN